ncbi:S1C family serine protease [Streptomyces sp. NPDC052396]|uniref:S1C family serine protease n=1 Tax=Streptomyces sp. NPDC052396 TaxID=3365689 RepID=UPI0037CD768A
MTENSHPQQQPQQPQAYPYPAPPGHPPQQPVTTAGGITVWPGDAGHGDAGHGGGGHAGFTQQAAEEPPAPRPRRTGALVVACALVAALVGGGSAALVGGLVHKSDSTTVSTPVQNASAKSSGVAAVAKAVSPSIVEIKAATSGGQSTGSGVIVTGGGEVITNNHVVAGTDTVQVTLHDGTVKNAKVVGTDPAKDLALIKIQGASGLKAATFGDSGKLQVGDQVVAIGSPEGLTGTVTSGIVSALNRDVTVAKEQGQSQDDQGQSQGQDQGQGRQHGRGGFPWPFEFGGNQYNGDTGSSKTTYKAIQTDASLNPGNSGGALINMNGEIIGINSAMYAPAGGSSDGAGSVGLGFAIPANTVKADLAKLRAGGSGQ